MCSKNLAFILKWQSEAPLRNQAQVFWVKLSPQVGAEGTQKKLSYKLSMTDLPNSSRTYLQLSDVQMNVH